MTTATASKPQYMPETDLSAIQSFKIDGAIGVQAVLRDLISKRAWIAIYAPDDLEEFVVSQLVAFDEQHLDLDFVNNEERRQAILQAGRAIVIGTLDTIKIQFEVSGIGRALRTDGPVLRCPVPKSLYRIQRRDAFRVRPLSTEPVTCHIRDGKGGERAWKVIDFSALGVAFELPAGSTPPAERTVLQHCRLEFAPSRAAVPVNLLVKRVSPMGDEGAFRVGCEFKHLASESSRALQIAVMEVEKRSRASLRD